ncbi:energy transducer TonB [Chondromyces apiculatus]|uniref:TonB family protein n=1 Tax=Chondromyces apiculatus DSM 436 TaxID=1192034 RepID=A0A017T1B0_9BACT|nr:energy transducer TonB [Chondromyces apiculatus]EYF02615.1 TonB family protein [Chondromyces apiculatus DSM 436]
MQRTSLLYVVSIAAHALIAASVLTIKERERRENIAISVSESKKKAPEPPAPIETPPLPEPPDKPAPQPKRAAKVVAEPKAEAPPPEAKAASPSAALDALPDFGLTLSGGVGPGGMAVPGGSGPGPVAAAAAPQAAATAAPTARKTLAPRPVDECADALVKPKPRRVPQPAYTASAREANVQGRVRVEVTVGAEGQVTAARILSGLGHGLDEAALEAARRGSFEPATRCGKAVSATFVIAMRFSL